MKNNILSRSILALIAFGEMTAAEPNSKTLEAAQRHSYLMRLRALPQVTPHALATFRPDAADAVPLRYFLFSPPPTEPATEKKFPLVVVLHHAGAEKDLEKVLTMNPESIGRWLDPDFRRDHPSFVVAPWSGGDHWESGDWKKVTPLSEHPRPNEQSVLLLIQDLRKRLPVDPERIYLTGQSMGAFGVWDLVARSPGLFAAAIPVCGGGDPAQSAALSRVPIWTFHGAADEIIPVERTREMAEALRATATRNFRYTEYPGASHDQCSERAFTEPDLANWLFANSNPAPQPSSATPASRRLKESRVFEAK